MVTQFTTIVGRCSIYSAIIEHANVSATTFR